MGTPGLWLAPWGSVGARRALEIAIEYAKERIQFGGPLSEKQGYTHKLIVPNAVRLLAGSAHLEEVGTRIDSGDTDLQVEGSINKYFCTEAANKTADDAVQALGGYGYINEYEVEKVRRDVKITTIYEGTSEIQQNIISTFRWKATRKTKGAFYGDMAKDMFQLEETMGDGAARLYGLAANALNQTIDLVHTHRLTRRQHAMFALADMMTWVESGGGDGEKSGKADVEQERRGRKNGRRFTYFCSGDGPTGSEKRHGDSAGLGCVEGGWRFGNSKMPFPLMRWPRASRATWRIWIWWRIYYLRGTHERFCETNHRGNRRFPRHWPGDLSCVGG